MKFNLTRFINLIKRDFIIHKKSFLFTCLGFWAFLAFIVGINWVSDEPEYGNAEFWIPIFLGMLFIGGLTFTALVFKEFKTPAGRLQFLSLPASNFEKLLSRWIYSLIVIPLFIILSAWAVSSFLITDGRGVFDVLGREGLKLIPLAFIVLHAVTFLQALYFNNLVPFKVTISGLIITILVGLVGMALFAIIFREYFDSGISRGPSENITMSKAGRDFFQYTLQPVAKFILIFFLAPYLWVVSYFKMTEKEA